jgi:hypothetical protein
MAAALEPLLDLAGLVDLEARPGCEVRWDLVPCPRAASECRPSRYTWTRL